MKKILKFLGLSLIIGCNLIGNKQISAEEFNENEVDSEYVVEISLIDENPSIDGEDKNSVLIIESTDSSNHVYEAQVAAPSTIGVTLHYSFTYVPPQSMPAVTTSYGYYYSGTVYRQYVSFDSGKYHSQYTGVLYRQGPI